MARPTQTWDLYYPHAAATGLPFARGRLDETDVLLVHAANTLSVDVRDEEGNLLARGEDLAKGADVPMACLTLDGAAVRREDRWPKEGDIGRPVILPGGEVGILKKWWNAPDGSEWRWEVEFYNQR